MFRRLMSFDEAKQVIDEKLKLGVVGEEETSLLEAYGRILAENVVSTLDIPPFNRSTVDGYAVKAADTFGAEEGKPAKLVSLGMVSVGEQPKICIEKGETAEIVTGAPVPEGADAIVMVEDTDKRDAELCVFRVVTRDENVMKRGSDIKKGETVLKVGRVLGASEIGVLAAIGLTRVKVFKVPVVAVLSTGAEVAEPGKELPAGKIYDINAYSLSTAVRESGGKPVFLGVVADDKDKLSKALKRALTSADMVLTSGGVSVGPKDYMPQIVNSLGEPGVFISGIAVKPGKPTTVALIGKKPVFSLPGHPTSALLLFHLLARPVLKFMSGRPTTEDKTVKALATKRMFSAKGRRTFVMVKLKLDKFDRRVVEPVETGASGAITTLAKADGFVEIPANQQFIDAGEEVVVTLLKGVL
ncbi:molybdopterin molybdenumtransferase MoeA [Candidatus Bathyarchaeota archaeon]|nr:molybdopterin molybdenumtransferase MoeA [Candidatus Bathyarchaeota archaeon]